MQTAPSPWVLELDLAPVTGGALVETLAIERERHPWRRLHMADAGAVRFAEVLKREPDLHPPVLVSPAARALVPDALAWTQATAESDRETDGDSGALVFSGAWDEVLLDYAAAHGLAVEALITLGPAVDADEVTLEGKPPWTILWIALVLPDEAGQASARVQLERAHETIVAAVKRERRANVDATIDAAAESRALLAAAAKCAAVPETSLLDWLGVEWLAKDNAVALRCALDVAASGVAADWMATLPGLQALLDEGTRELDDAAQLERLANALRHLNAADEIKPDLVALLLDPEQASWVADFKAAPEAFLAMARLRFAALEGLHAFPSAAQLLAYNVFKPELGRMDFVDSAQLDATQWQTLRAAVNLEGEWSPAPIVDYARAFSRVPERMSPLELGVTLARADLRPSADCMRAKARNRPAEQQELSVWRPDELKAFALATFYGEGNLRIQDEFNQNEVITPFGGAVIMEVLHVFLAEPSEGGLGLSGWATWERYLNDAVVHAEFDALVEAGRKGLLEPDDWTVMPHFESFMLATAFARFTVGAADVETYGDEIDKPLLGVRWWYVSGVPSLNAAQRDQHGDAEFWSLTGDEFFPDQESTSDFLDVLKGQTQLPQDRDVWVTLMGSTFECVDAIRAQAFERFDDELSAGGMDLSFAEELEYPVQLLSVYGEPGAADALVTEIEAHARAFPETPLAKAILERAWPAPRR